MARKGSSKVRTGCLTCKQRKVKCDEAKPACGRCVKTGRACEGYAPRRQVDPGLIGWHRPRSLLASADDPSETRALQYFCQAAGPGMSGAIDPNFWNRLVVQFSTFEPAVRHSVVAISSLFEKMKLNPKGSMAVLEESALALAHYTRAIGQLKASDNQALIVLACVLFICIEVLQNNTAAAIQHCKHGIVLLNDIATDNGWVREFLVPMFRRLALLPLFFAKQPSELPDLPITAPFPQSFKGLPEARDCLYDVMLPSMLLYRLAEPYRQANPFSSSSPPPEVPSYLVDLQTEVAQLADKWHCLWTNLLSRPSTSHDITIAPRLIRTCLNFRYQCSLIWASTAFDSTETCYDTYLHIFTQLINSCAIFETTLPPAWFAAKFEYKFMLEMGYLPILFFVAVKCRDLEVRLHALQLMMFLGAPREGLWDAYAMYKRGVAIIEAEHGCVLDVWKGDGPTTRLLLERPKVLGTPVWDGRGGVDGGRLPPDDWRVRGDWMDYWNEEVRTSAMDTARSLGFELGVSEVESQAEPGTSSPASMGSSSSATTPPAALSPVTSIHIPTSSSGEIIPVSSSFSFSYSLASTMAVELANDPSLALNADRELVSMDMSGLRSISSHTTHPSTVIGEYATATPVRIDETRIETPITMARYNDPVPKRQVENVVDEVIHACDLELEIEP